MMHGAMELGDTDGSQRPAWWTAHPPRVGVSSCLLGQPVRYNGGHTRERFLTDLLGRYVEWVPVCPEVEVGMGTPREALHLTDPADDPAGEPRLVTAHSAHDYTDDMAAYAGRRVGELASFGLSGYVFKAKSPTCGLFRLPVRSGDRVARRDASGAFSRQVRGELPRLAVEEEGRLNDPPLREHFVERLFAHARLHELFDGDWQLGDLVDFHARHKLQLLAHDPARLRTLGQLVASARGRAPEEVRDEYCATFLDALAVRSSRGRNVNVLQHAVGYFGEELDAQRRHDMGATISAYRQGSVPLSVPATLLLHHTRGEDVTYLRTQTFFDPFPAELGLRNHT